MCYITYFPQPQDYYYATQSSQFNLPPSFRTFITLRSARKQFIYIETVCGRTCQQNKTPLAEVPTTYTVYTIHIHHHNLPSHINIVVALKRITRIQTIHTPRHH